MSNAQNVEKFVNLPRFASGAGSTTDVWTPASGKNIRLLGFTVTALAATVLTVQFSGTPTIISELDMGATVSLSVTLPLAGVTGKVDQKVQIKSSAATTVGITAFGREE